MRFNLPLFCSLAVLLCIRGVSADVFTAIASMEALWKVEKCLLWSLKDYIAEMEYKMTTIRRIMTEFEVENKRAKDRIQDYLSNPINAYLLTKRLTVDWKVIENLMTDNTAERCFDKLYEYLDNYYVSWPTKNDLRGAAMGITRLQRTYDLKTSNLAEGEIIGFRGSNRFSSSDCFELGVQAHQFLDYEYSEQWLMEAFQRHHEEFNKTTYLSDVLEWLASVKYHQGNYKDALTIIQKVLDIEPDHEGALHSRKEYRKRLREERQITPDTNNTHLTTSSKRRSSGKVKHNMFPYKELCSQRITVNESIKSQLKCRYVDFGRPYLKLAKVKEEEAYLDPRIVIYHDIISEREMNAIKALAVPSLHRAQVDSGENGDGGEVDYRISEVAWLTDYQHPRVTSLVKRIEAITNLDLNTAESLQVLNYGIGGHYEPHWDNALHEKRDISDPAGRRIATILFYLSDVAVGGATVFIKLNVTVMPKKGSAILWYNLLKNGDMDVRTLHGACPVLIGSKWVCTKWLHEGGQEFRRPCDIAREL